MFSLLKKYFSLDKTERIILNRTIFWLTYSFILVRIIPLKWFNSILGEFKKDVRIELSDIQQEQINIVIKSIKKVKKKIPWKVKCFEEAIAAKKLLEFFNLKTTIYLGVKRKKEKELIAHAWLKAGEVFITGKNGHSNFVVVGFYS